MLFHANITTPYSGGVQKRMPERHPEFSRLYCIIAAGAMVCKNILKKGLTSHAMHDIMQTVRHAIRDQHTNKTKEE
jgi:hypothetical protein